MRNFSKLRMTYQLVIFIFSLIAGKKYIILIDAGFTSNKLNIYEFNDNILENSYTEFFYPGLQNLKQIKIKEHINKILKQAKKYIEKTGSKLNQTKIAFIGTEGLRTLQPERLKEILKLVEKEIRKSEFYIIDVGVMNGIYEGLYAWESLIYLNFLQKRDILGEKFWEKIKLNDYDENKNFICQINATDGILRSNKNSISSIYGHRCPLSNKTYRNKAEIGFQIHNNKKRTTSNTNFNNKILISYINEPKIMNVLAQKKHKLLTYDDFGIIDKKQYNSQEDTTTSIKKIKSQSYLYSNFIRDKDIYSTKINTKLVGIDLNIGMIEMGGGSTQIALSLIENGLLSIYIKSFSGMGLIKGSNQFENSMKDCKNFTKRCIMKFRDIFNLHEFVLKVPINKLKNLYLLSFFYDRLSKYQKRISSIDDIVELYTSKCVEENISKFPPSFLKKIDELQKVENENHLTHSIIKNQNKYSERVSKKYKQNVFCKKECQDIKYIIYTLKGLGVNDSQKLIILRLIGNRNLTWGVSKALEMNRLVDY